MKNNSVLIEFETTEQAQEFVQRLNKVKEKGSTPLYNSLLTISLKPIKLIEIVERGPWN